MRRRDFKREEVVYPKFINKSHHPNAATSPI